MDVLLTYIPVVLGVVARIFASAGWKLTPAWNNGKFQVNIIPIILVGFLASVPILNSINVTGADPVMAFITIFLAVYGAPAVLDKGLTSALPEPAKQDEPSEGEVGEV